MTVPLPNSEPGGNRSLEVSAVRDVTTARAPAIEAAGFHEVYQAHYASLVRLATVTTGNQPAAEDLVQEAFAEYYRRGEEIVAAVPYLRRAVISRCTSWHRRRMLERRRQHTAALWSPRGDHPLGPDATAVRAALSRLRPRQRAAVFLRYYLDLPEAEIAEAVGCRPGTVKSLLSRALNAMKEHLDDN
jgi:RNA polymerase sigma factor (sigma-70 family)